MLNKRRAGIKLLANVKARPGVSIGGIRLCNHYKAIARGPDGRVKWVDEFDNLVVTAGLNDSLDKHLKGSSYTAGWYTGLADGSPSFAAGDTMGSHAGWAEVTDYDEANRITLTLGSVSSGSVDNSGDVAVFTISGSVTIGGAFVTSNNSKGGTTGVLYGGGAFSGGDRSLGDGDTLEITITLTAVAA